MYIKLVLTGKEMESINDLTDGVYSGNNKIRIPEYDKTSVSEFKAFQKPNGDSDVVFTIKPDFVIDMVRMFQRFIDKNLGLFKTLYNTAKGMKSYLKSLKSDFKNIQEKHSIKPCESNRPELIFIKELPSSIQVDMNLTNKDCAHVDKEGLYYSEGEIVVVRKVFDAYRIFKNGEYLLEPIKDSIDAFLEGFDISNYSYSDIKSTIKKFIKLVESEKGTLKIFNGKIGPSNVIRVRKVDSDIIPLEITLTRAKLAMLVNLKNSVRDHK